MSGSDTAPNSDADASAAEDQVEPASFDALDGSQADQSAATSGMDVDLNVILNVDVDLALQVGKAKVSVRDLLKLNHGSVVELDRLAGEPLDVLINGMLIARGEVVVVNENYGIRLTEIVSPADRIKKIQ